MSDWNYSRDDSHAEPRVGKNRCVIVSVEEAVSKTSGLPMIVVAVKPSGSNAKVKTYIVKNERFNKNMTNLFDSFPSIGDGNFNFLEWVGAEGAADFGTDDNGYLRVKWFITPKQADGLPPFVGEKPEKQTVSSLDDDVPFDLY